jgi:hypothetical protein
MELRVRRSGKLAAIILLLCMSGCRVGWLVDQIAPDAVQEGKTYFEELRLRQVDQLLQSFDPSGDKNSLRSGLGKVIALVPQQGPIGVETVGVTVKRDWGSGISTKVIALEYTYPDRWILFRVTVSDESGRDAITDLSVYPESMPLESLSRFTLRGKGLLHYAILLMGLLSVGLALYALLACIRTPIRRRKWLWIIVTILGIGKLGIDWSSGELWYKIPHIAILPAGWGFNPESPFVYASVPAGAIVFLLMRSRLQRTSTPL